ncbi:hypothetical protein [Sinorhizobium meliloti]|nr:hypothetical protein [Sinorhizobium meliloti]
MVPLIMAELRLLHRQKVVWLAHPTSFHLRLGAPTSLFVVT